MVPYAHSLNISVTAFGQEHPLNVTPYTTPATDLTGGTGTPVPAGNLSIVYVGEDGGLEPAPVTPDNGPSFQLLAGTIKAVWGNDTLVTPTGMYGQCNALSDPLTWQPILTLRACGMSRKTYSGTLLPI